MLGQCVGPSRAAAGVSGTSGRSAWPAVVPQHGLKAAGRRALVTVAARRTKATTVMPVEDAAGQDADKKAQAFQMAFDDINRRFGSGTIMRLGDHSGGADVQRFSSGSLALDAALGGGYPRGRIVEVYGPEASGKTTLAMAAALEVQRGGGQVVYVDVEHAFDTKYATAMGIDIAKLGFAQPNTGEEALELIDALCRSVSVELVILDSVAALVPKAELEGDIGAVQIGAQARLLSAALRKLAASAKKSGTTLFFINQLRNKVGLMFGNPETTSGGSALKYYSSVRIDIRKKEVVMGGDDGKVALANKVRAKVVKNKTAPPLKEAVFDIVYGKGIDVLGGTVEAALAVGVLTRKGAYYYMGEERLSQGLEKLAALLRQDPAKRQAIEDAVRASMAANPDALLEDVDEDGNAVGSPSKVLQLDAEIRPEDEA